VLDALEAWGGRREYGRGADAAIGVGLVGAAAAAAAGLTDWQATDGGARRVGLLHGIMNLKATALFGASWWLRRTGGDRGRARALAALGFLVAAGASYLGGSLVFSRKVGVNHAEGEPLPQDFVPVIDEAELHEGEPWCVDADGVKVLLLKRGGRIHAIAETCSHMGGPLAEGKVEGATVRCPWHGSRFSVETGEVIDGPATHPQPCLETRVRDGRVEVRARENRE
jgi:nitrite reductase/ring-hydroxylating ferredoxin subunit